MKRSTFFQSLSLPLAFLVAAHLGPVSVANAQDKPAPGKQGPVVQGVSVMVGAAKNLIASLDEDGKAKALFALKDEERQNWHFIPRERKGLSMKEMTPEQRLLTWALLSTGMSNSGYAKSLTIMSLEKILWRLENQSPKRDPEMYFISIFGSPEKGKTWGWRMEGHHLSLNFTIIEGKMVSTTPSFFGANPGHVKEGARKGLRAMGREEDMGRRLFQMLTEEQKKIALIAEKAPKDILTGGDRKVSPLEAKGLSASKMDEKQKVQLIRLVREYVQRNRHAFASAELDKIQKAGHDKLIFAWAGSVKRGEGQYYRVQGPTFLLEYDNTQNGANHPHAVWRNFANDFGEDLLKKHYQAAHSDQK